MAWQEEVTVLSAHIDYASPSAQFAFDLNGSPFFIKDANNYINQVGVHQLNTLKNVSLLDIKMSANHIIEPHYHQNAEEIIYCISGVLTVTMLNPFTKQLQSYTITPGQVVNVPQGWWHYEVANTDHTHLIAIFDANTPEVILGSDLLTLTPAHIMAYTYCMNENMWRSVTANVQPGTIIGPACRQATGYAPYVNASNESY